MHYISIFTKFIIIYWQLFFAIASITLVIYLLKWPLLYNVKDIKINCFAYIGATIYISFYFLFFMSLRWIQINKEINLRKITENVYKCFIIYNKTMYSQIFFPLSIILCILLWIYIFIKMRKYLSYQVYKVYFYYRYKYLLDAWKKDKFKDPDGKIINFYEKYLSFYKICSLITRFLKKITKKLNLLKLTAWLNNLKIIQNFIRIIMFLLIFVFFLYDCYFFNFTLVYTKYYLFFYMIFSLWYRISTFFRHEIYSVDKIIFEIAYCAPNVVYINLTQEEYEFLNEYLKDPNVVTLEFLATFIWATPPVAYHKRFVYTEVHDILDISENGYNRIPYNYVYKNKKTQRYFPAAWLKENNGRYYTDQEL